MLDSLTSTNHRDFAARYAGTIGWFLNDGKKILVRVGAVNEDQVTFTDVHGASYLARADAGIQFEFIPVDKGFFNGTTNTYFLERVPARQWHRGIAPQNTRLYICNSKAPGPFQALGLHIREIADIFVNPVSVHRRLEELKSGATNAAALSKHFLIHKKAVYFYKNQVGTFDKNNINLDSSLVYQEVSDMVRRNNLDLVVTHS